MSAMQFKVIHKRKKLLCCRVEEGVVRLVQRWFNVNEKPLKSRISVKIHGPDRPEKIEKLDALQLKPERSHY